MININKDKSYQKVKEFNDIKNNIQKLKDHKLRHKKDYKANIKILMLLHRQRSIKKYVLRKYNLIL
ncbi:hypothetical protein IOLA_074 [uncultured bacterium]|nr:hypothetical protein IOLA_074 [uncultured bacterium]